MTPPTPLIKKLSYIGLAAMAVLAIGASVFYKERSFFADTAYVLFNVVNTGQLAIQYNRYGAIVAQCVPWLGQRLHWPLKTILVVYSVWPYVFYLLVGALLVFRYRQYKVAVLMALFYVLFVSQLFYWGSEIPQGMAFFFLMLGITLHMGERKKPLWRIAIPFVITGLMAVFTHFTIMIAAVYTWVYLLIDKENWPFTRRDTILLSALLALCIAGKFVFALVVANGAGDGPILASVFRCSIRDIYSMFSTPLVATFLLRCATMYWAGTVIFLIGIANLFIKKKYGLAAWTLLSLLGYMCVMALTFGGWDEGASLFHVESEWFCMSVIVIVPFALSFLPVTNTRVMLVLLPAIFMVRFVYIYLGATPFTRHLHMQEEAMRSMKKKGIRCAAILKTDTFVRQYVPDWAAQYETMLASAAQGDNPQYTFSTVRGEDTATINALRPGVFNTSFGRPDRAELNSTYFNMDTVSACQVMTYEELTGK